MESKQGERVIALVDMDCFYVQVEQKLCPEYQNRPCAVVQYNTWKGGGIIAVNYEARAQGVSRMGRGEAAQQKCPDIHLFRVPEVRGKADLTKYREAGASVLEVLCKFSDCVERASIDEAYIDLTSVINSRLQTSSPVTVDQIPNTFAVGYENPDENQKDALQEWLKLIYEEDHLYNDRMLAEAAVIVEEMRAAVYSETGYRCSAGIAHNKMLAKLSCGLHKPNKQTVLPESSIPILYNTLPVNKVRNLGGKLGVQVTEKFNAKTMGDLMKLTKSQFINAFGEKTGSWLYGLSRGIENEPVTSRQLPKSIGCGKNFPGKSSLNTKEKVLHWVKQLSSELEERLLKDQKSNCRVARLLTISVRHQMSTGVSMVSRSCPILIYNADKIAHDAYATMQKLNTSASSSSDWNPPILSLAMSASKFEDKLDSSMCDIQSYFTKSPNKEKDNPSISTMSNIDTVLQLLDTEPGLSNPGSNGSTNTTPNEKDSPIRSKVLIGNSVSASRDISRFFSSKASTTSQVDHLDVLNSNSSNSVQTLIDCKIDSSMQTKEHHDHEVSNPNKSATKSVTVIGKEGGQKIQGFFAKKLEERSECLNEKAVVCSSSTDMDEMNNLDRVESASIVNSDSMAVPSSSHQNELQIFGGNELQAFEKNELQTFEKNELQTFEKNELQTFEKNELQTFEKNELQTFEKNELQTFEKNELLPLYPLSELDPELTNLCTKCNKRIPIWEEEEHSDYHLALDLSKETNKVTVVNQTGSGRSGPSSAHNTVAKPSKTNRKRGNNSKFVAGAKKTLQQNTIDSFFR